MYIYYLLALLVIAIDQLSKWIVVNTMDIGEHISVIDNFFYITSHRNSGGAWGILQGQMILFYIVTIIVVIGIVYFMQRYAKENKMLAVSLSLMLAGAIGNFIDRLFMQEVVDFLDFVIFSYDYPIFNIADSSLVIGVILVFIMTIYEERKEKQSHDKSIHSDKN